MFLGLLLALEPTHCPTQRSSDRRTINPEAPPMVCSTLPGLPWYRWLLIMALLTALGAAYATVHRIVLQRRVERRILGYNMYLSEDRKSTRLNSSNVKTSIAVNCV